jgi:glyoxylase-like metal-dependent hydrolase (beta-lactamase superfamily II)
MAYPPVALLAAFLLAAASPPETLTPSATVIRGPVNGVLIHRGGKTLAVYGDPRPNPPAAERVLFTHSRRDVAWAGRSLVERGAEAIVPAAEKAMFTGVGPFWQQFFTTGRFHDYANQSTRVLAEPFARVTTAQGGDHLDWQSIPVEVLDTPGYTRGAVTYFVELDGKRIAFPGDLIYAGGKLLDLYSLQDAIPEVKEDGYHGYASRASAVIASLRNIAARNPDIIVPARGPVIRDPQAAIDSEIARIQAVFRSHFSIDALRWYRGDEKIRAMAARVLDYPMTDWMPMAETRPTPPEWIVPITNSRLIVSQSGAAFLVDCGNNNVVRELRKLQAEGRFKTLDGIYITHYHDDHTDLAQAVSDEYHCPIYATAEMRDILEHPDSYHMPCLTPNAMRNVKAMQDGVKQRWKEFDLTYSYYPGQTLFHGGLLLKKDSGENIFFIGDSFTPTGVDDYCLTNRNFLPPEKGFVYCLNTLRNMNFDYQLINEHVLPTFHFSPQQIDLMLDTWKKRDPLFRDLFPWDDPDYGLDEQWARFYPYTNQTQSGQPFELRVIVLNHSAQRHEYRITPHAPAGWSLPTAPLKLSAGPREQRSVRIPITPKPGAHGLSVVTADVAFGDWDLREWTEALVMEQ